MDKPGKVVAWICIPSSVLWGCYDSALIKPTTAGKEKIYTDHIEYVVTRDGRKYEFTRAPVVANDTIVGVQVKLTCPISPAEARPEVDSIPYSDVAIFGQSTSGKTTHIVTWAGAKYTYAEPPTFGKEAYVGKATFTKYVSVELGQVSIPLSDVAQVSVSSHIEYVVTEDGKKYEFEKPPTVVNDTIVGEWAKVTWRRKVNEEVTSIPQSDVAWVEKRTYPLGNQERVVTKAGLKYRYEEKPTLVNGDYIGIGIFEEYVPMTLDQVSIPVSDAAEIYSSRYNPVKTWIGVGAIGATIAVTVAIIANNPIGPTKRGTWW